MDPTAILAIIGPWIVYLFPSSAQYVKYIGPALVGFATAVGIFTNLLPEPGHVYPVPDVKQLQAELEGNGGFILKIATFTRSLVIGINWFLATAVYAWFYNGTNRVSAVLAKVKLAPKPLKKA